MNFSAAALHSEIPDTETVYRRPIWKELVRKRREYSAVSHHGLLAFYRVNSYLFRQTALRVSTVCTVVIYPTYTNTNRIIRDSIRQVRSSTKHAMIAHNGVDDCPPSLNQRAYTALAQFSWLCPGTPDGPSFESFGSPIFMRIDDSSQIEHILYTEGNKP